MKGQTHICDTDTDEKINVIERGLGQSRSTCSDSGGGAAAERPSRMNSWSAMEVLSNGRSAMAASVAADGQGGCGGVRAADRVAIVEEEKGEDSVLDSSADW